MAIPDPLITEAIQQSSYYPMYLEMRTPPSEKVIHKPASTSNSERTKSEIEAAAPKGDKDQGEVDSSTITSGVSIPVSTQGQTGSDPKKAHEALAGLDPEPMQEDQTLEKYMCLLLDQTLSTWMMNSSLQPTQRFMKT
ncbi:hypothetical protein Tco_0081484 [Tanacetum coccineum]